MHIAHQKTSQDSININYLNFHFFCDFVCIIACISHLWICQFCTAIKSLDTLYLKLWSSKPNLLICLQSIAEVAHSLHLHVVLTRLSQHQYADHYFPLILPTSLRIELISSFYRLTMINRARFVPVDQFPSIMMTSSNGNIFRVTGHLCGEFTGPRWIPRTKAGDAEL